jgi:methylthioxylose transferase
VIFGLRERELVARESRRELGLDLLAVLVGAGLVLAAALVGWRLIHEHVRIVLGFPPLLAHWMPHVGLGTVPAVLTAAVVVAYGPGLAARLPWRPLLSAAYVTSVAWTLFLALVDGWSRGITHRLYGSGEFLPDIAVVHGIPAMLRQFSTRILTNQPHHWSTYVGAHPPGAFLIFLWLDRIGLDGGGPAGVVCILIGASAAIAVAVTLRELGAEVAARAILPFAVLFPGAVWVGVSADGLFAGVLAWGVALLAIGAAGQGRRRDLAALAGGLLLGFTLYLSYGMVAAGLLPVTVVAVTRAWRAALIGALGVAAVVAAFTASGFWWLTGYRLTTVIYGWSVASTRPYTYFAWADLAALLFAIGPAALAGLRRLVPHPRAWPAAACLLTGAALIAVLVSDISGLSKGEVERIWLPFAVWLLVPCALLPPRMVRGWLCAQALLALLVNHLLLTFW